jgi:Flp pilus assembly protein TadG
MGNIGMTSIGAVARKCRAFIARLSADRRGNVLTEMAIVMPMFATLAVGTFDMGRFAIEQNRLEQVARAGAQYALQNINLAGDTTGMQDAAMAAALVAAGPDSAGITVVAARVCSCAGTGVDADCTGFCDDGNVKAVALTVTATHTLSPIFSFPNFIETKTLVADVTVQVQ